MADRLRLTILGCGSSPGVPRLMGDWGACDPNNPKNRRYRSSALIERIREDGKRTTVVIDTGPDFRSQMLMAQVKKLDAAIYTHPHADHIHGIDDLRGFVLVQKKLIDLYADRPTTARLKDAFGYCFETPSGSSYPPIVKAHEITHYEPFKIAGEGGPIDFEPLTQMHGDIFSIGYRIGDIAYCPDVSAWPEETVRRLSGLDLLVIDALQYISHPSHYSLSEALEWIEKLGPRNAILTHMHIPLDYETVARETPDHVTPAYDGMIWEVEIS
ncbi:MBL fold metallo-hydrolase [Limoniibacter endophyticus]|uniref:Phosphoribosyl 1,2-cyclic phosphodiesterase n=1 Tax=Limoniibacter endophyticus TaxID=1565040 RepID=A0A8J3DLP5_9HYPH|nr:MBL fold metallo-hydrolase [Limoniibacter endophyticus]GHC61054.1 phosphoribosyl 1,2-cyclic phosphodiesterase [Limoniibacter endophyticus]